MIDVETILKERDVGAVDRFIPTIVQYILEEEQAKVLDINFVKMFRISQLAVEFLLFCKKYLDNTVVLLKKELAKQKEVRDIYFNYILYFSAGITVFIEPLFKLSLKIKMCYNLVSNTFLTIIVKYVYISFYCYPDCQLPFLPSSLLVLYLNVQLADTRIVDSLHQGFQ